MKNIFFLAAAIAAFTGIAAGAFGAHALNNQLDIHSMEIFQTAVRYQMYHALALFTIAFNFENNSIQRLNTIGWLFILGMVLFSGSLYLVSLTSLKWFGAITPLGGIAFLSGWLLLVIEGFKLIKRKDTFKDL